MLPGELNAPSHMCRRPRVQGNFMNLQCKYFQNPLCVAEVFWWPSAFWSQIPKGKLQIPTFSRSCLRITEIHKVLVYNQRNTHSALKGMLKGVITPTEGVLLTHRCSAHGCLWFGKRKNHLRLPYSYTPQASKFGCWWRQETGLQGLQIQSSLCPCFETGEETEVLLMLRLTFIFSNFWSPMKTYSKACMHSHKPMLLFSEMLLFSSRSTMFNCYSMKILGI